MTVLDRSADPGGIQVDLLSKATHSVEVGDATFRFTVYSGVDTVVGSGFADVFTDRAENGLSLGFTVRGGGGFDYFDGVSGYARDLAWVSGVEQYVTRDDYWYFHDSNFVDVAGPYLFVASARGGVDASAVTAGHGFWFSGSYSSGVVGGDGDDVYANLTGTVDGGGGHDSMLFSTGGDPGSGTGVSSTFAAGTVSGIEFFQFGTGENRFTLTDANFTHVTDHRVALAGGPGGLDIFDGSALTGPNAVWAIGDGGLDRFTGGAAADVFAFDAADLAATDRVFGGGGQDGLLLRTAGAVVVSGVSGVEFYQLAGNGSSVALADSNFAGVQNGQIGVAAGAGGGTLDASGVAAPHQMYLFGGTGNDVLRGGGSADVMAGGGGADAFFAAGGIDNILVAAASASTATGFTHGIDHVVFSDSGFDLGSNEGQGSVAYQPLNGDVVSPVDGVFTSVGQRLAYENGTGHLLYAAQGSATAPADIAIVMTFTDHPALTGADLFFTI